MNNNKYINENKVINCINTIDFNSYKIQKKLNNLFISENDGCVSRSDREHEILNALIDNDIDINDAVDFIHDYCDLYFSENNQKFDTAIISSITALVENEIGEYDNINEILTYNSDLLGLDLLCDLTSELCEYSDFVDIDLILERYETYLNY